MHSATWKHCLAPAGTFFIGGPPSYELLPDETDCPCCPGGTLNVSESALAMFDGQGVCIDCMALIAIEPDPRVIAVGQKLKSQAVVCSVLIVVKEKDGQPYPSARLIGAEDQILLARPIVQPWINKYAEKWKDLIPSYD